jgi:hypothetical protein
MTMEPDFATSLLAAIAELLSEPGLAAALGVHADEVSPFSETLADLRKPAVTFDIPANQGIQGIRASDPAFDLAAFLAHVGEMFAAYHKALDSGDPAPVRRFLDEPVYAQFDPAVRKAGPRAGDLRALKVNAIRPMTAKHEDGLDLVRVLISADVVGTADVVCEYWELIRKRGTLTKPGLDITHCPNCGGPVDGLDPSRCAYCGTRLADPALDWVVSKITEQ